MHPNSASTHRLSQSSEIPVQLLLTNSQYLFLFFLIKCFPYSRLDFDYAESSGVPEHLHILLNIKEREAQLLSIYISHNLHRAEHSRNPGKRKLRHNVAPIKNTLPQHNSVARCKISTIKNCTILTYVAPFCIIPGQKLL